MKLKQPNISPLNDNLYNLDSDYVYEYIKFDRIYRISIPEGFIYDGATVPRWAWTVSGITPDGLIRAAALVHDWIYVYEGLLPQGSHQYRDNTGQWQNVSGKWKRKHADKLFARIMRESGVSKFKRRLAYIAVRIGGAFVW